MTLRSGSFDPFARGARTARRRGGSAAGQDHVRRMAKAADLDGTWFGKHPGRRHSVRKSIPFDLEGWTD